VAAGREDEALLAGLDHVLARRRRNVPQNMLQMVGEIADMLPPALEGRGVLRALGWYGAAPLPGVASPLRPAGAPLRPEEVLDRFQQVCRRLPALLAARLRNGSSAAMKATDV
jgi:hypothetical protein